MTLKEVSTQLYNLAVGGYLNGEKFTKTQFIDAVKHWMRGGHKKFIGTICLPDGEWYYRINQYADRPDGYDYYIPDTKEQNEALWDELVYHICEIDYERQEVN